jgi:ketosteroid isomerase-like protein
LDTGHPYVEIVRRLTAAYTAQDRATLEELIAEDCIWRVPGHNLLAGVYVGRVAIFDLFNKIKSTFTGPVEFEIIDIAVSDTGAAVCQYANGTAGDRPIRMKECLVYTISAGRVVEMEEYQFSLRSFDEAFPPERPAADGPG